MAKDISISRPTMREVLNTLVGEGLLTRQPTTRVLQVTTSATGRSTIYVARTLLELGGVDAAADVDDTELHLLEHTVQEI